ncbi:MAG: hypothetical protein U0939_20765 [Pirellulales bacterium]
MPIEFRCAGCQKLLRTPDDSAGKKARCPDCGAIVDVPASHGGASGGAGEPPSPGSPFGAAPGNQDNPFSDRGASAAPRVEASQPAYDGANPYAAPGMTPEPTWSSPGGTLTQQQVTVEQLLSETWNFVKANFGMALLFGLIPMAGNVASSIVSNVITTGANLSRDNAIIITAHIVTQIIGFFVQVFIQTGTAVAVLHWMRSGTLDAAKFFHVGPYYARALGLTLLIMLVFLLLFVVTLGPGVALLAVRRQDEGFIALAVGLLVSMPFMAWFGMQFYLGTMFLVDRQAGVVESLRLSKQYMYGNRMTVFLAMIIMGVASLPVICLTCGFGSLMVVPFYAVANALVYFLATGQSYFKPPQTPAAAPPASWPTTPPQPPLS